MLEAIDANISIANGKMFCNGDTPTVNGNGNDNGNDNGNNNVVGISNNNYELKFLQSIKPVDPTTNGHLLRDFTGEKDGFVQVGPKKYLFPSTFAKHAEHFYNFQARHDDIWIATFPRSGTTWTQELVWMIANDLDYDRAQRELLTKRSPFFEFCVFMHDKMKQTFLNEQQSNATNTTMLNAISVPGYEFIPDMESPRFIKTHLPFTLMPPSVMEKQAKIIYVARNPKDVIVSYYYLSRTFRTTGYVNDFEKFWEYFERDLVAWSPYWEHIKEGWEHRHEPNVLFMFYEDMNKNLPATIQKVASFLNKRIDNDQIERLVQHLSIENFRNNTSVNQCELIECGVMNPREQSFVRNGKASLNGWPKEYTPEIVVRVQAWIAKNLENTTLRFPEH